MFHEENVFQYRPEVIHTAESQLSVNDVKIDHRVHGDRHRVSGQDLRWFRLKNVILTFIKGESDTDRLSSDGI